MSNRVKIRSLAKQLLKLSLQLYLLSSLLPVQNLQLLSSLELSFDGLDSCCHLPILVNSWVVVIGNAGLHSPVWFCHSSSISFVSIRSIRLGSNGSLPSELSPSVGLRGLDSLAFRSFLPILPFSSVGPFSFNSIRSLVPFLAIRSLGRKAFHIPAVVFVDDAHLVRLFLIPPNDIALQHLVLLLEVIKLYGQFVDFILNDVVLIDEIVDVLTEFFDQVLLIRDILLHHFVFWFEVLASVFKLLYFRVQWFYFPPDILVLALPIPHLVALLLKIAIFSLEHVF